MDEFLFSFSKYFLVCSICYVGDRLISKAYLGNDLTRCSKDENSTKGLYQLYCGSSGSNVTEKPVIENPDCEYLKANDVGLRPGIPGLPSGVFYSTIKKFNIIFKISVSEQKYFHFEEVFRYRLMVKF